MGKKNEAEKAVPTFAKEQIVASNRYERFRDFLQGNLEDGKMYSKQEVDDLLEKYMKGIGE